MTKTNEHPAEVMDKSGDRFSSDFETLKSSFAQLRNDVTRLLDNTVGAGKSGVGVIKNRASTVAIDLKDRAADVKDSGIDSIKEFGQKIGERPLLSAAIALGIGFVLARLLTTRR